MAYFKGTKEECEAYNEEVSTGEKYSGTTSKWSDVIEIEDYFYIIAHPNYPSNLEQINKLPINNQ